MTLTVQSRKEPGDSAVDGLAGGVLGGILMAAVLLVTGFYLGRPIEEILGSFSFVREAGVISGLVTHLSVSAIYGAVFGLLSAIIPGRINRFAAGAVFGLLLYFAANAVLVPQVNQKLQIFSPTVFSLAHIAYGSVLGWFIHKRRSD